jgi:hypothetical protein
MKLVKRCTLAQLTDTTRGIIMGLRDFTDQTFEAAKKGMNKFRGTSGTPLPPINSDIPTGAAPPGVPPPGAAPAGTVPPASAATSAPTATSAPVGDRVAMARSKDFAATQDLLAQQKGFASKATSGIEPSPLRALSDNLGQRVDAAKAGFNTPTPESNGLTGKFTGALEGTASAIGTGLSFAPHLEALGDDSPLTTAQKAKLVTRDTLRAAAGIVGGGFGGTLGSAVPVAGTLAGGAAGAWAGYEGADALGGLARKGLNYVNGKLGGDPNYITSTDDDLRKAGYNPDASALQGINGVLGFSNGSKLPPKPSVTAAAPTADTTATATATAPVVPPTATELANQRMGLSVADQRRATDMTSSTNPLRDANKLQAMKRTPGADPAVYNLGKYGGSGDIYGTQSLGVGKIDTFTGTGDGSANNAYEKSEQYQQASRNAQKDRDMLAQIRAENARAPTGGVATLANPVSTQAATGWRAGSTNLGSAQLRAQRDALQVQREHNQMTNNTNLLGHQIQDNNNRRSFDSSMYGHDIAAQNNQLNRAMELQKLRLNQSNNDRDYELNSSKFGREQSQDALNNKVKMDDHIKSQLSTIFTKRDDKGNTVPDMDRVGESFQAIQKELGARVDDLNGIPKGDPQYAQAQQLIAKYNKGTAALQPDDIKDLMEKINTRERMLAQHGIGPGSATFVDSRLDGYTPVKIDSRLLGSDVIKYKNGGEMRVNDRRFTEPGNMFGLNAGKIQTDKFGPLRGVKE